ncbi:hypothetical protein B0H19DRAFT_1186016 [Mycena capillaripes]|nr:hypothetical protein B0H19DRAFT_1186016 [Mycena capillaripes]
MSSFARSSTSAATQRQSWLPLWSAALPNSPRRSRRYWSLCATRSRAASFVGCSGPWRTPTSSRSVMRA